MEWPDIVNGLFELLGGIFVAMNVRRVLKDKSVAGVSIPASCFFAFWGYWNIFYYPHLNQWVSFVGGLTVTLGNTVWVILALWFRRRAKK